MPSSRFNRAANRVMNGLAGAALRRQLVYGSVDTAVLLIGAQPKVLDSGAGPAIFRLLELVRAAGLPVVHSAGALPTPENGIHVPTPSQRALLASHSEGANSGGQADPRLAPGPTDMVLEPRAELSRFAKTGLAQKLSSIGITRVILAGARTDVEVDSTARDAVERGFQTTVIADCCWGTSQRNHDAAISLTFPRLLHGILTLQEFDARITGVG